MSETTLSTLIQNYIYFYHLGNSDSGTYLILPMYPDTITDTMRSSFATTNALARSAPVFTYSNSGPRSVSITLDLHRDLFNQENSKLKPLFNTDKGEDYVDLLINYLQACALPKYQLYNDNVSSIVPPMIAINFGETIFIKGVVNSDVSLTYKKPILIGNKYAQVLVTFTVYETEPYSALEVATAGSFRGVTSGFLRTT